VESSNSWPKINYKLVQLHGEQQRDSKYTEWMATSKSWILATTAFSCSIHDPHVLAHKPDYSYDSGNPPSSCSSTRKDGKAWASVQGGSQHSSWPHSRTNPSLVYGNYAMFFYIMHFCLNLLSLLLQFFPVLINLTHFFFTSLLEDGKMGSSIPLCQRYVSFKQIQEKDSLWRLF
jgi:hypothetical protein